MLNGRLTGLADARIDAYARNQSRLPPITGRIIPEPVRTRAQYLERMLEPMYRAIAPHDADGILQHEWLNSHGAIARFDRQTIEIRLLDSQEHPGADLAIAALVVAVVERLYNGDPALLDAADALDTELLATLLRRCVERGENAIIDSPRYLQVLGVPAVTQSAGTVWRKLARLVPDQLHAHRCALDVILGDGTLATRLLRSIGSTCDHAALVTTYRRLRECLASGRMFRADA